MVLHCALSRHGELPHSSMQWWLEQEACVGVIWWEKTAQTLLITPLVLVRETATLVWEQAC